MRYVTVQRLRGMLYGFSDAQYEEFYNRLLDFDPEHIDPDIKRRMLKDVDEIDSTGALHAIVESGLESAELLREGKRILTEMTPNERDS
jgi:hypothetical protein